MNQMTNQQCIELLKQVVDAAVQKGLFATAQDVVTVGNALMQVSSELDQKSRLENQIAASSEKVIS
jgi:hypothetical protein